MHTLPKPNQRSGVASTVTTAIAFLLAIVGTAVTPSFAEDAPVILAQAQGQGGNGNQNQSGDQDQDRNQDQDRTRDRDRDMTDADMDRIRDRLRDGSCQDVAAATDEVLGAVRLCLSTDGVRDGRCTDQIEFGVQALERTRERCGRN
jgi:hypothetical protein